MGEIGTPAESWSSEWREERNSDRQAKVCLTLTAIDCVTPR